MCSNNMENIYSGQKGVSLVITFLIMTIMLGIVLSASVILYSEINVVRNMGNSIIALYAAESGAEKTLYYDRKQIPFGASRGFCNLCGVCVSGECNQCAPTPVDIGGCDLSTCDNCRIQYNSVIDDKDYFIDARIIPDDANPGVSRFTIKSRGYYKDSSRSVEVNAYSQ